MERLSVNGLSRGDVIIQTGTKKCLIVRQVKEGLVYTVEKANSKRGPVLNDEELGGYNRYIGRGLTVEEYRKQIISRYLERHRPPEGSTAGRDRFQKEQVSIYVTAEEKKMLLNSILASGKKQSEYIMAAVKFYEEHKETGKILNDEQISDATGLSLDEVRGLKNKVSK